MKQLILMLEDDHERIARFTNVLVRFDFVNARTSAAFIEQFARLTAVPALIALDHDLFVDDPADPDPGDGRDAATFLATQSVVCPVLIHSTNAIAAESMLLTLRDAGWHANRIAPIGDDWIEADWFPVVRELLKKRR